MIYLTEDNILAFIQVEHLSTLTAQNPTAADDIEQAEMERMAGYLNVRYDYSKCFQQLPIGAKYAIIQSTLLDLVLYEMHKKISPKNIPDLRVQARKDAITWLEQTASGYIAPILPIKADEPTGPLRYGNSSEKTVQFF